MYLTHYGFERQPFRNTADPRFFYRSTAHEEAMAAMLYGVTQRQGVTLVTGETGSGKTLLAHCLVETLGSQADAVILPHVPDGGRELITTLCRSFGVRYRQSHSTAELIERLKTHLLLRNNEGLLSLVILDQVERLTSEVVEQVRLLSDLEHDSTKLLQIVLLGRNDLEEQLSEPSMEQFRQRIATARTLSFFERDQTRAYIRHRLEVAGAKHLDLFQDEAIELIHDQAGGSPRLINQIADAALLSGYSQSREVIDRDTIAESVRGLVALHLARVSDGASSVSATETPPHVPTSHEGSSRDLAALHEAGRRGMEVMGRLDEASRQAIQRIESLSQLISRAAGSEQTLDRIRSDMGQSAESATAQSAKFRAHVEEAEALNAQLTATRARIKRWYEHHSQEVRKQGKSVKQLRRSLQDDVQSAESAAKRVETQTEKAQASLEETLSRLDEAHSTLARVIEVAADTGETLDARREAGIECDQHVQQLLQDLNAQVGRLDDLILQSTGAIDRLEQTTAEADRAGDAFDQRLQQGRASFEEHVARQVRAGEAGIADLLGRLDSRREALLNTLESGRELIQQLEHQDNETCARVESLRSLLEEACRQIPVLSNGCSTASHRQEELASLLQQVGDSTRGLEGIVQSFIDRLHEELNSAQSNTQSLMGHLNRGQSTLQQALQRVESVVEECRRQEEIRAQQIEETDTAIASLSAQRDAAREAGRLAGSSIEELRSQTAKSLEARKSLIRTEQESRQVQEKLHARSDYLHGLMQSTEELAVRLGDVSQEASDVRSDLTNQFEDLARQRGETRSLLEQHDEVAKGMGLQVKQARKVMLEIETGLRDLGVASGEAASRKQDLTSRVQRASEILGQLETHLPRASQLAQQLQNASEQLTEGAREARQATRELANERLKAEEAFRKLRAIQGGSSVDPASAMEDADVDEIPTLRLRLNDARSEKTPAPHPPSGTTEGACDKSPSRREAAS